MIRVRTFDRKYLKPLLLREYASNDEKLLNTFKKINEFNVNKMAENPEFVLKSKTDQTANDPSDNVLEPDQFSIGYLFLLKDLF